MHIYYKYSYFSIDHLLQFSISLYFTAAPTGNILENLLRLDTLLILVLKKFKWRQNKNINQHICLLFMYIPMPKCSCADDRSSDMHKASCLGRSLAKLFQVTFSDDLRHRHFVRQWFTASKLHISLYSPSKVSAVLYNLSSTHDQWHCQGQPDSFLNQKSFIHLRSVAYFLCS